jgi:hypothetical protein
VRVRVTEEAKAKVTDIEQSSLPVAVIGVNVTFFFFSDCIIEQLVSANGSEESEEKSL